VSPPGRSELERARDWAAGLAAVLDTAAREAADLARRLAIGWPDDHGREWNDRLQILSTALQRDAEAASQVTVQVEQLADDQVGPRLGATGARRADDERGVRIPRLDDRADARPD
jgi:hypothetical protein